MSITSFVGMNGSGKSLAVMENEVLPAWRRGRLVVSNMTLYPERLGFPVDLYRPLTGTAMIPELGTCQMPRERRCEPGECRPDRAPDHCDDRGRFVPYSTTEGRPCLVVFDEINACFPSRAFSTLPPEVARKLQQLRKYDVTLAWTSPRWLNADVYLRSITIKATLCRGLWSDRFERSTVKARRFPRALRDGRGKRQRVQSDWLPHRVFLWRTYDGEEFEEFNVDKVRKGELRPLRKRWYWRTRHAAHLGYDTLEGVDLLDHVDDYGICMRCRGTRKRPVCRCAPMALEGPQPPTGAAEATEGNGSTSPVPWRVPA